MTRLSLPMALAAGLLFGGCPAHLANGGMRVPEQGRLFVAVFVDESEHGEAGVPLTDAVKVELFRRDPSLLAIGFEEGTIALDGTVHAIDERAADDGRYALIIRASARLVGRDGALIADLGPMDARTTYRLSRDRRETEQARARALDDALRALARETLRRVHRAAGPRAPDEDAGVDAVQPLRPLQRDT